MSHRTRAENRAYKARKDPHGRAKKTKTHVLKTVYDEDQSRAEAEMLDEIDEFFAEYAEPDPEIVDSIARYTGYKYNEESTND